MYCPRCSQRHLPEEVRFCSRCGFHLSAVSELLLTDGIVPFQPKQKLPLIKQEALRKGAVFTLAGLFSFVPSLILASIIESALPLLATVTILLPVLSFLFGLVQMFCYLLFGKSILPLGPTLFFPFCHKINCRDLMNSPR